MTTYCLYFCEELFVGLQDYIVLLQFAGFMFIIEVCLNFLFFNIPNSMPTSYRKFQFELRPLAQHMFCAPASERLFMFSQGGLIIQGQLEIECQKINSLN